MNSRTRGIQASGEDRRLAAECKANFLSKKRRAEQARAVCLKFIV
jgi:hypothetical protein